MTWIEYDDELGSGWHVTLVDGRIDQRAVLRLIQERHPEIADRSVTIDDIGEVVCETQRNVHREVARQEKTRPSRCDYFVFRRSEESADEGSAVALLLTEDPSEDTTYILRIDNGCRYRKQCMQRTIEMLGMKSKPRTEYSNFGAYRSHVNEFAGEMLMPYVAPCMITEERIRKRGYECCGE